MDHHRVCHKSNGTDVLCRALHNIVDLFHLFLFGHCEILTLLTRVYYTCIWNTNVWIYVNIILVCYKIMGLDLNNMQHQKHIFLYSNCIVALFLIIFIVIFISCALFISCNMLCNITITWLSTGTSIK